MATLAAGAPTIVRPRTDATDQELVAAVRAGDDRAFEVLYDRYRRRIGAYVFGMVKDHGRAEDVTQEVFLSALRRMRETDREIAFKAWIYEIAKNACIDAFRRSRRAEEVSYDAEDGLGAADHRRLALVSSTPDAQVAAKQDLDHLRGAFDGLSETQHQILVLREFGGLSYREIGERLGMTRPAVESTLFRARRRLSDEYSELVSGERCLRIQEIIEGAGARALGVRDQRRVGSHIASCQTCRREARLAGLDAAAMARRPVREKLAALFPLPFVLRRRFFGAGEQAAQLSATAASYGDAGAGWLKAVVAAAAIAAAGVAGGVEHRAGAGDDHAPRGSVPSFLQDAGAPAVLPAGGSSTAALPPLTSHPAVAQRTGRAGSGGAAVGTSGRAGGSVGTLPSAPVAGAEHGVGASGVSPAATAGSAGGANSEPRPSAPASQPAGQSAPTGTSPTASAPVQTPSVTLPPLVNPEPGTLVTPPQKAPQTVGETVSTVTDTLGGTVGGTTGKVVTDVGTTLGQTVDGTTKVVGGTLKGVTDTVDTTVKGVTGTTTQVVGGLLGGTRR